MVARNTSERPYYATASEVAAIQSLCWRLATVSKVAVVDYDPVWPSQFEDLRAVVWPAVADFAITIEHVGSTAVPGLAAKPVIDIDVVVPEHHVTTAIARLAKLGYSHRGDLRIPGREAFRRPTKLPQHHLYVCPQSSAALANHLAVRNSLRKNPAAAREYGELKKQLSRSYADDMDGYIRGKTEFLTKILRDAGFDETALAEIARINVRR